LQAQHHPLGTRTAPGREQLPAALLCGNLSHKRMTAFHGVVLARRFEDFSDWSRPEGEELGLVLKGRGQMFTEFYEPVQLRPGDCA
jgi:hypothetical protein